MLLLAVLFEDVTKQEDPLSLTSTCAWAEKLFAIHAPNLIRLNSTAYSDHSFSGLASTSTPAAIPGDVRTRQARMNTNI